MEPRLNDVQRTRLWEDWVLAEARAYYFADMAARYHRLQRVLTYALLLASAGALASLLAPPPAWIGPLLTGLAAVLAVYSTVQNYQGRAIAASDLYTRWARKARAYERLWDDMYAETALYRLNAIEDSDPDLSRAGMAMPWKPRRMRHWQDHVELMHHVRLAA